MLLGIAVVVLAVSGIWLAVTVARLIGVLGAITEQINLISKQVHTALELIQGIA